MSPARSLPFFALSLLAFLASTPLRAANATGTLVNLSTRIRVPDGGTPAIVGCALGGSGTRTLLVRAVGPGLAAFGVGGTLRDPKLTVYDSAGRIVATSNDWDTEGKTAEIVAAAGGVGAFALTSGSKDAATVITVGAGSYTVHVAGVDASGGVALIELYALGTSGPKLVNLSVRGYAGAGADTLTAGFVSRGTVRTLLGRGVGPTLASFGVSGTVPNPRIRLIDSAQATLNENQAWGRASDPNALGAATQTVGAFALITDSLDTALLSAVNAGSYTLQVNEGSGRTGEALIEVYDVSAFDPAVTNRTQLLSAFNISPTAAPGTVPLTHSPMALADLGDLAPMGLAIYEHVTPADHMYIWGANRNAPAGTYAVYAPAAGYITSISHRIAFEGVERNDYRVTFEHSGTFFSYYDLLDSIDPSLLTQVPGGFPRGGSRAVRIPVTGGQLVGRIGGKSLDFAVVDITRPNSSFVVPDHYLAEPWKLFTVDPFDAFVPAVRTPLLARAMRTQAPRGGRIGYDISGRLVGNWFLEGTNGYSGISTTPGNYWSGHLSIVYHYIDAGTIVVSLGTYAGGAARQFAVRGNSPLPDSVSKETGPVKYELINMGLIDGPTPLLGTNGAVQGTALFQVLDDDRLRVEIFPGQTAAQVAGFTAAARTYER